MLPLSKMYKMKQRGFKQGSMVSFRAVVLHLHQWLGRESLTCVEMMAYFTSLRTGSPEPNRPSELPWGFGMTFSWDHAYYVFSNISTTSPPNPLCVDSALLLATQLINHLCLNGCALPR